MTKNKKDHKLQAKRSPGRPLEYDEPMSRYAIKLPDYMVNWLSRKEGAGVGRAEMLRTILEKAARFDGVLPADPGPGKTVRSSYALPQSLIDVAEKRGRGRGYTIGIRRCIRADIGGMLNGLDKQHS